MLLTPLPETETELAFELDHVTVVEPGAFIVVGLTLMAAVTGGGALTVTVCEIVDEDAPLESTACAVNVTVVGPRSEV